MWKSAIVIALCAVVVYADQQLSVPEPTIEAFSPKGLRLSIPDSPDIKSVQFFLSFTNPVVDNDPGSVAKEVDDKQGSHWIYYNPSLVVKPGEKVHYKISITTENGGYRTRFGTQSIDRVLSLADNSVVATADDCDDQGQQHLPIFPNLADVDEPGLKNGLKSGQIKSAYSMYKSMETKPITRSSTTTTTGTFYVKPTGDVEASGYKSASSYDSTRREGDQWQHSKTELSAAEIEELKSIHGQDFMSLPAFSHLHGGSGGSSGSYRQSSYSSSSQSRPSYGSSSSYLHSGQTGQTAEMLPLTRPSSGFSSFSKWEKHESTQGAPIILNPSGSYSSSDTSFIRTPVQNPESSSYLSSSSDSSYIRKPVISSGSTSYTSDTSNGQLLVPAPAAHSFTSEREELEDTQVPIAPSYSTVKKNYHRKETVTSTGPVVTYPSGGSLTSKLTETHELQAPPKTIVSLPLSNSQISATPPPPIYRQQYYNGDIFRSPVRPTTPQSCAAANFGYKSANQVDVVALEKTVQESQCLSVLAETIMKAEIRALKEANTNLEERLQDLDQQFRRFRSDCKCGY